MQLALIFFSSQLLHTEYEISIRNLSNGDWHSWGIHKVTIIAMIIPYQNIYEIMQTGNYYMFLIIRVGKFTWLDENDFSRRKMQGENLESCSLQELHGLEMQMEKSLSSIRLQKASKWSQCAIYVVAVVNISMIYAFWSDLHKYLSCCPSTLQQKKLMDKISQLQQQVCTYVSEYNIYQSMADKNYCSERGFLHNLLVIHQYD